MNICNWGEVVIICLFPDYLELHSKNFIVITLIDD